jgi:threonine dehydratase
MPLTTPLVKVTATRGFGAEVVLHGGNYDEACTEATRLCEAEGMTFIHPFDDALVMAGQGTIGLELLEQVDGLEAVVVPIGGGGLIGGVACAVKESNPKVRVIGVQTAKLPSMQEALAAKHPVTLEPATTIADGIAVRRAGDVTFPVVERYVDEIVTVDEDEIASAILTLLEREKTLAEGAGATALAAMLQRRTSLAPETRTAVLVCGGNIDVTLLSRIIERGLVQDGRLIRLRIHLLDRPGALLDLTGLIASHRVNIVDTLYNRAYYGVNLGDTAIDITMETRGREQVEALLAAMTAAGYRYSRVL